MKLMRSKNPHPGSPKCETRVGHPTNCLQLLGSFLEGQGELSLAGGGRVVEGAGSAIGFGGFEEESAFHPVGKAGEAGFAIGVGADFEIELADAGESVGDVDCDFGGVDRLGGGGVDGEIGGGGAEAAVDDRDGMGVGSLRN